MAHRLSKITTRTGDAGETGLGDGARVPKDSARIQALGDVDELNSALGLVLAEEVPEAVRTALEQALEAWNVGLPALQEFILPGGSRAAAAAHLARTICRRAERSVVGLGRAEKVSEPVRRYLNRLSDLLFVAGRVLNRHAGRGDVQWRHERKKS
jgi:cob(I)alamin adenosyltransferase